MKIHGTEFENLITETESKQSEYTPFSQANMYAIKNKKKKNIQKLK